MDITHLKYFLTTARLLNYSKAAEELYITRQSLRQAIDTLEQEIGKPLFSSLRNKISLTESGKFLVETAAPVVQAFDHMCNELEQLKKQDLSLTVAVAKSLFPFIIPGVQNVYEQFHQLYPSIQLKLIPVDFDSAVAQVGERSVDAACILQMPYDRPDMCFHPFRRYDASLTHNNAFDGKTKVGLKELQTVSSVGMGAMNDFLHPIAEQCRERGITLQYEPVYDTIDAYYRMNHSGTVLFDIIMSEGQRKEPEHYALLDGYQMELGLLYPKDTGKSALISLFCQMIEQKMLKNN